MKNALVEVVDGKVICTSVMVAEKFNKEHYHVLRDIKNLECSQEFRDSNFGSSSYTSKQGKRMIMYRITRDGFTFLAMGFTGKDAAIWKEKYISAFNAMEKVIQHPSATSLPMETQFDMALKASHMAYSILRASDSARIAGISRVCDAFNVSTVGLPKYLPREAQILSATELLKRNGKPMTVHAFNFKMLSEGLLEIQTRPSTSGSETRRFKALTEEGKAYGENSVNPDYPLETQPHYFSDKFSELLERLNKTVLSDD